MPFKSIDEILAPDKRFAALSVVENGIVRPMTLADHHRAISNIDLHGTPPSDVRIAFDRARNAMLYAFFDYDLFVVGELQAFGALEFALKHRLNKQGTSPRGTLRNLVDRARKLDILPPNITNDHPLIDPLEALIMLRNDLSHGSADVHPPGVALDLVAVCAGWIDHIYPRSS